MKIVKAFKNNELLAFTDDNYQNLIKIHIDDNYHTFGIKKGYKMNLLDSNKGSYKGSFMNNYICKKFIFNQKVNLTNIETNKILNYCKYFLLSDNEYFNYFNQNVTYNYYWFLRSPNYKNVISFLFVYTDGTIPYNNAYRSSGFVSFVMRKRLKNENNKKI